MNTAGAGRGGVDPAIWREPAMRAALAVRDMGAVFALLKRHGISQRRIAGLTDQAQPEVSEILRGRQVMAYDLLSRIADGLGIPRGLMGLAYEQGVAEAGLAGGAGGVASWVGMGNLGGEGGPDVERRGFITLAAKAAIVGLSAAELGQLTTPRAVAAPATVTGTVTGRDVASVESAVRFYRAQDDACGGGAVLAAVSGQLNWAVSLLHAPVADEVRRRLLLAVADLHSVAGWVAFDTGDHTTANRYLVTALAMAKDAEEPALRAKILFQMGRVFLHRGDADGALKMFQLGQAAAQDADSPRALALLHLNSGWAYAELGKAQQVGSLLARAEDEMGRDPGPASTPTWLGFMGQAEIDGISAMAWNALAAHDRSYADKALLHATRSYEQRPDTDARSRASDLVTVAANQLRAGNVDAGLTAAHAALPQVEAVHSTRLNDRLEWISQAAALYPDNNDTRQLVQHISTQRATASRTT
ncbi:XRE family transcriptional regulator [Amycolatopsis minnesotensis]|uniref:Helix-turn-helix transcriptional regulator n=1 Tax=Amycolatopsis minnesotensis TaxID=337894 RepID=A0ABN2SYE4_9PSEU